MGHWQSLLNISGFRTIYDHILKDRLQLLVFQEDRLFFSVHPSVYFPKFPRNANDVKYQDDQRSDSCYYILLLHHAIYLFHFIT